MAASPMNVSWNDLNNVDQAGEYPFRDGTITVTFAEIAVWKKEPDAQFQLMRKNPIHGQISPLYIAEFQFRYNNRFNDDIFGTAIEGCW
jgi:hypothetical protein